MPEQLKSTQAVLAIIIIVMMAVFIVMLFYFEPPDATRDMINIALGVVLGMAKDSMQFFFGSSQGSKDKSAMIAADEAREDAQSELPEEPEVTNINQPQEEYDYARR